VCRAVIRAQRAGIPLGTIHEALARLSHDRTPTERDWERLSRAWHGDVEERIKGLELLQERLTSCIGCGCLSLQACGLFNPAATGATARYLLGDRLPTRGG
jgi:MerR family redox-sensitive transcriptional activator SoxR